MKATGWWKVVYGADYSRLWAETSDEEEAREALLEAPLPRKLQRLYEQRDIEWRDEQ